MELGRRRRNTANTIRFRRGGKMGERERQMVRTPSVSEEEEKWEGERDRET